MATGAEHGRYRKQHLTCQVDHLTEFALSGDAAEVEQPVLENRIFLPVVVR